MSLDDVEFAADDLDWRAELEEDDPDDEQVQTPSDVTAILGFDPAAQPDAA